ncbi:hypothetical protein QN372_18195 [Undibacterium sp. RTI2.1]|uniref:hypothetical protein n=1 Tax=unclassified Undibacterium TaxID=2630295 RepID=UPI002AB5B38E|nr:MULTISPECIES: hypothetical protein [unclassified Undibacterium]MDY7540732.1 hypothetical protein [Undibacterium sp. 5I1]MEB0032683.1 hypothetical protein [Undibacterium sp. RTI2.1]
MNISNGLTIVKTYEIPIENEDHGGEKAVCLKTSSGETAWGFGNDYQQAADDAEAAFNGQF